MACLWEFLYLSAYSIVVGNSKVVSPNICTKLGFPNAFTTKSATTVESFPPEKEITIFSSSYFSEIFLINSFASSTRYKNLNLLAVINFDICLLKFSYELYF